MDRDQEWDLIGTGENILKTHGPEACAGETCCIHNPSDHSMRHLPMSFRPDKLWLAERHCPHGMGHPDPDSLAYYVRKGIYGMGVHGCCGICCKGAYAPELIKQQDDWDAAIEAQLEEEENE